MSKNLLIFLFHQDLIVLRFFGQILLRDQQVGSNAISMPITVNCPILIIEKINTLNFGFIFLASFSMTVEKHGNFSIILLMDIFNLFFMLVFDPLFLFLSILFAKLNYDRNFLNLLL